MQTNDVLRSVRYMLDLSEAKLAAVIAEGGQEVSVDALHQYLKKDDEADYLPCPDEVLGALLDGLVYVRRGRDETRPQVPAELPVSNNTVLKKLRVAFELKDVDIQAILKQAGFDVSTSELGAFFRKPDHRHYRPCGDQFLRNFLKGLTLRVRR
ncbi:DUF1456 family protein [Leeia oryzae]|uniref:DUF1456 family protein n=1 Tax=Leeia oryzae TaxID=356662 RepID=UPI00036CA28E|nr:DUF1456 family protein [Leeia oryzae]